MKHPQASSSPKLQSCARFLLASFCTLLPALPALAQTSEKPATEDSAAAQPAPATPQALCPVTKKPIDHHISVDFRGKKVYFADEAAKEKFAENPFDYVDGIKAQWEALRPLRIQVLCPVTEKPIDPEVKLEQADGTTIFFATKAAKTEWEKSPERYAAKLDECYTFQVMCPCGYGEIKPEVTKSVGDKTIYFCCPGCRASFDRDPAAGLADVEKQIKENRTKWQQTHPKATTDKQEGAADTKSNSTSDKPEKKQP